MFGCPCISNYIRIINQHDALFSTSFCYHATACFGPICSPSSGGQVHNIAMALVLLLKQLLVGQADCHIIHLAS
jgi:hypothetical protein